MCKVPRLFELMKERNVTQKKLSEDTGISTGNISDWKSGRSAPSIDKIVQLAEYFGVTTDYLLGQDSDANSYAKRLPAGYSENNYTDCYVAYLDILGFTNYTMDYKNSFEKTFDVFNAITTTLTSLHDASAKEFEVSFLNSIAFKFFSDTIILAIPKSNKFSLDTLCSTICGLAANIFTVSGLLLRGAISDGDLYINEIGIFGSALIDAYHLGEKEAKYPRIILSEKLLKEYVNKHYLGCDDAILSKGIEATVIKDEIANDTKYIVNTFGAWLKMEEEYMELSKVYADVEIIKTEIEKMLDVYLDEHIREKNIYFANYYNKIIKAHNARGYNFPQIDITTGKSSATGAISDMSSIISNDKEKTSTASSTTDHTDTD